jgi:hypothetical protein
MELPYLLDKNTGTACQSVDDRIGAMACPVTFADDLELVALAFLLPTHIHIIRRSNYDKGLLHESQI